ncbi:helix-turn-helix domain-containing protein [Limosilactobacillus allomucosae]|uniref:Helix-turn-helix domain-containing protein n=1 Tax=Limosilactobacillus allomucosae TaxID=3142938 RepID=A0AAU7C5P6_9LACO
MTTWQDIKPTLKLDPAEQANIEKLAELSALRISNNISQTVLARQIGVSQAVLNSWENLDETPIPESLAWYEQGLRLLLN